MFTYALRNMGGIRNPEKIYPGAQDKKAPDPGSWIHNTVITDDFFYHLSHLNTLQTHLYTGLSILYIY
jgi:hypothetical protein